MMREKTTITASVRPQKVAVMIPADINEADFRDILQFLGWLWGGKYSCIVPFDLEDEENELAFSWLAQYSPDLVLCASHEIRESLKGRIQETTNPPLQIVVMHKPLEENFRINHGGLMSWNPAYERYVKEIHSQPDRSTRYRFVSTAEDLADRVFYDLSFGVHPQEHCEGLAKQFKAKSEHVDEDGIPKFIAFHDNRENPFSYLDFAGMEIDTINAHGAAPTIFVLSRSVFDYAWFWNCRFEFSAGGNDCIPIPADSIDDNEVVEALASWVTGFHSGKANYCEIKSISTPKASLERLATRLRPRVKTSGVNHVDVCCHSAYGISNVSIFHKTQDVTATWIDSDSFEFTPPELSFAEYQNKESSGHWIVELEGGSKLKGHMPPAVAFQTNTRILNTPSSVSPSWLFVGHSRRYSAGNILIGRSKKSLRTSITLPTAEELLSPYLEGLGVKILTDEKRTCYEAVFSMFGEVRHFISCCKGPRHEILSALWSNREVPCEKNGHSYSKGCHVKQADAPTPVPYQMIRSAEGIRADWNKPFSENSFGPSDPLVAETYEARKGRESGFYRRNYPVPFLEWLVENDIVRRVLRYPPCPTCMSKANWVTKVDLEEPLKCSRCGSHIAFHESKFEMEYQLNSLVCRAFDEGVRPVALTLDVLKKASSGFMYLPGFKGKYGGNAFDIDVIAICDGRLVFCECKDMFGVPARSKAWKKIEDQFTGLIDHAERFGTSSVVLASLADAYPVAIKKLVKQRSTDTLRVVLLTKDELLQGGVKMKRDDGSEYSARLFEAFFPQGSKRRNKTKSPRIVSYGWGTRQSGGKCN